MQLEDRFFTSTEVAEILGVSLRSVYRYLEDGKLIADVKTATGRHRFTRDNINNFLYPDGKKQKLYDEDSDNDTEKRKADDVQVRVHPFQKQVQSDGVKSTRQQEDSQIDNEEEVDWLAKFREAASKYREEQTVQQAQPQQQQQVQQPQPQQTQQMQQPQPQQTQQVQQPQPQQQQGPVFMYYRSMLGGLKDIAQNLDRSARNSNLDYAFTLSAGASLHKPIKPFATLHSFVRSSDRDFFEKILRLTPANQSNAQLCLVVSDNQGIYSNKEEIHGLFVVSKNQLKNDINTFGDPSLMQEMADVLG